MVLGIEGGVDIMENKIYRDCRKIHKRIRKFYEKYKDKRNICLNLKCDKENDSYDICLYVNPSIKELNVMKENIKLEKKRIEKEKENNERRN